MKFFNKIVFGAASLAVMTVLSGCMFFNKDNVDKPDYIAVQSEEDGEWGFLGPDGKVYLADEFKEKPTCVVEGHFSIPLKDGGYALYKFDEKKPMAVDGCEELVSVGTFNNGMIPVVYKKSRINIIGTDGKAKFVLEPVKGKEIISSDTQYHDGMLVVCNEDNEYGYVDKKGNCVIEPKFKYAAAFNEDKAVVRIAGKDDEEDTYNVIDKEGKKIFSIRKGYLPYSYMFQDDRLFVCDKENRYAYYDEKGELTKLPARVEGIREVSKDLYVFRKDGEVGVMNFEDEIIVRPKYESIRFLGDKIIAHKDDKIYILDKNGEEEMRIDDYEGIIVVPGYGVFGRDGHNWELLDDKGEMVKGCEFYDLSLNTTKVLSVASDFFNYDALAQTIADQVSEKAFGKYAFKATAANVLGGKATYSETYSSTKNIYDYDIKGYRYSSSLQLFFTQSMANYSYDYWSYSSSYTWNPDSRLNGVALNVTTSLVEMGKAAVTPIVNALKKKGFKAITAEGKNIVGMKNGKTIVIISSKKDSYNVQVEMVYLEDGTIMERTIKDWIANNTASYEGNEEEVAEAEAVEAYEY